MKRLMIVLFLVLMAPVAGAVPSAAGDETIGVGPGVTFRVERGDTFRNLFGKDWYEAWRQNRIVVMRDGRALSSPDILLEGAVVTVTAGVHLTPRAQARVVNLADRRAQLGQRLEEIDRRLARSGRGQELLATCRRGLAELDSHPQRTEELTWQLEELEALGGLLEPAPVRQSPPAPSWPRTWLLALPLILLAFTGWMLWYVRTNRTREAKARYARAVKCFQSLVPGP